MKTLLIYIILAFVCSGTFLYSQSITEDDVRAMDTSSNTAQRAGQEQAIQNQINSKTIKNVVSPDRLRENPDVNLAESIGRLPGISLIRSSGEGTGFVIRGLLPRYTMISLNGIILPSTNVNDRSTSISGISQYAIQDVEVYKSLTADMDANSAAGAINLTLRKAPESFHLNAMVRGGYNQLNNYWGNSNLYGEISNRFFNKKLGLLVSLNAENVNRSMHAMAAGYGIQSGNPDGDILLNNVTLNNIFSGFRRRSAVVSMDYNISPGTSLSFYGLYNNSQNDYTRQSKNYYLTGAGSVGYSFGNSPDNNSDILQTSLSGESKSGFLNFEADYGLAYSVGNSKNVNAKSWDFALNNSSSSENMDTEHRKMDPSEIVPLFSNDPDNLTDCWLTQLGVNSSKLKDENFTAYLNLSVPVKIGDLISGDIKFGAIYRVKNRSRDDQERYQNAVTNPFLPQMISDSLPWIKLENSRLTAEGLGDEPVNDFLKGEYNFGSGFNTGRLNEISNTWGEVSDHLYSQGPSVYLPVVGNISNLGYIQNVTDCLMNDQDLHENYLAGYIQPVLNFGKHVMFMPGFRYENTHSDMKGYKVTIPLLPQSGYNAIPTDSISDTRSDQFFLPMIHMRIIPTDNFYMHFSYTQTLSRPDFNSISPSTSISTGFSPYSYSASSPGLKPELWTNIDAQFSLHGNKIGLISVTGFYKTVRDKIWSRSYPRIKGDPVIEPFPDNAIVNVSVWENNQYPTHLEGIELEWRTSFFYLPRPLNFFTLCVNYTYTHSETSYPYTQMRLETPAGGVVPSIVRVDSATKGPMLFQPKNIVNASLGFNFRGFNAWVSFQYNGLLCYGKNYGSVPRLDGLKDHFYRWDLQLSQKFSIAKLTGFEVIACIANLSDFTETQHLRGDIRPTYQENYGMSVDLGVRYGF
jgi:TonB-dependent receptor